MAVGSLAGVIIYTVKKVPLSELTVSDFINFVGIE